MNSISKMVQSLFFHRQSQFKTIMSESVKTNLLIFLFAISGISAGASDITLGYIEEFKDIAISEMQRVGIPASIKLAQAIVESASGTSTLARQSNNHFGIKCGNNWKGETVYRHDDDYQNGLLIRSCFRSYDDPKESFYAHSEFLANPYSRRYKPLFELEIYDYKAWANGLKKAGYATDKSYPQKLINIIEKYELYKYDDPYFRDNENLLATATSRDHEVIQPEKDTPVKVYVNKDPVVRPPLNLDESYIVKVGDTMAGIADNYNLDLKTLYFQNRMPFGSQPQIGEELLLREYLHFKKRPKMRKQQKNASGKSDEFLFEESIEISSQ